MTQGHFSLFLLFHFPGSLGDSAVHCGQRIGEDAAMAYCHAVWMKGAQLAGAR